MVWGLTSSQAYDKKNVTHSFSHMHVSGSRYSVCLFDNTHNNRQALVFEKFHSTRETVTDNVTLLGLTCVAAGEQH